MVCRKSRIRYFHQFCLKNIFNDKNHRKASLESGKNLGLVRILTKCLKHLEIADRLIILTELTETVKYVTLELFCL